MWIWRRMRENLGASPKRLVYDPRPGEHLPGREELGFNRQVNRQQGIVMNDLLKTTIFVGVGDGAGWAGLFHDPR